MVKDREAWRAAVHRVSTVKHGWVTEQQKGITIQEWLENVLIEGERKMDTGTKKWSRKVEWPFKASRYISSVSLNTKDICLCWVTPLQWFSPTLEFSMVILQIEAILHVYRSTVQRRHLDRQEWEARLQRQNRAFIVVDTVFLYHVIFDVLMYTFFSSRRVFILC